MTHRGRHRRVVYQRRSLGGPVPLWGGGLAAFVVVTLSLIFVSQEPAEPALQQGRAPDLAESPTGGAGGRVPGAERAVEMAVVPLSPAAEARLWARVADRPEDDEAASVEGDEPPATEAQYLATFLRHASIHGDEALGVAVQAVLETDLPDCAKLAGLRACEQQLLPNVSDLLGQALVAPTEPALGRIRLADWAALRLGARAAADPQARELLSALVEGSLLEGDLPMRRRAATSLARHGSDAEVSRLLAFARVSPDTLLAPSVELGLAERTDAWGRGAQSAADPSTESLERHGEP